MQKATHKKKTLAALFFWLVGPATVMGADTVLIKKGEKLYNQNCVFCHQADAIGKPGVAPSLTNPEFLSTASDKFIKGTIRDGRSGTGMPPFAHLGRTGINAIVAYLRAHTKLPNRSAEIDKQPKSKGDPRLGKLWYDQICSTCHGPDGDGYVAGGTGTAIGKAGFLKKASDGFIRETIRKGRSNTRMLGFQDAGPAMMAALSDREIDDIIAYLRTVPSK
jgi:cytochrome c oxidase cbb3-type subunit 3